MHAKHSHSSIACRKEMKLRGNQKFRGSKKPWLFLFIRLFRCGCSRLTLQLDRRRETDNLLDCTGLDGLLILIFADPTIRLIDQINVWKINGINISEFRKSAEINVPASDLFSHDQFQLPIRLESPLTAPSPNTATINSIQLEKKRKEKDGKTEWPWGETEAAVVPGTIFVLLVSFLFFSFYLFSIFFPVTVKWNVYSKYSKLRKKKKKKKYPPAGVSSY